MSLANRIQRHDFAGGSLYVCKTSRKDIVAISGSFLGGLMHAPNECMHEMLVGMLDEGTGQYSRDELHDLLESMGISMHFDCDNQRTQFYAETLNDMWPQTLDLLYASLTDSRFDESCFEVVKSRMIGSLSERKSNTRLMGRIALKQALYDSSHPNYEHSCDEVIEQLRQLRCEDVKTFYQSRVAQGELKIVCVGDVSEDMVQLILKKFAHWQKGAHSVITPKNAANARQSREIYVPVPGKVSSDVFLAQPLYLDRHHPDFHPLMIAIDALGGNFAARLMRTVRDVSGLTYGIYSSIGGVNDKADGYWSIWANYAPGVIDEGIAKTLEQCRVWREGISADDLNSRVEGLTGKYHLNMASSAGIGSVLLSLLEQGYDVDFIDEYPHVLKRITLDQVNAAIEKHIDLDQMLHVISGVRETSD